MKFNIDPQDDEAKNLTNIIFILEEMRRLNCNNLDARLSIRDAEVKLKSALHFIQNPVKA